MFDEGTYANDPTWVVTIVKLVMETLNIIELVF
jgi:hypothetical protein